MNTHPATTPRTPSETRWPIRFPTSLLAVNAVLVAVLSLVTLAGPTSAAADADTLDAGIQPSSRAPSRARGEYTVISPKSADGNTGVLVVIDSINEEMAVLDWDKARRTLVVTGFRDLTADSTEVIGR